MIRPGPRNLITDVAGLRVGHAEDHRVRSGTTVVLAESPAIAAIDIRGGAPATRGADGISPGALIETVDAVFLSGGSSYGLGAGEGLMSALAGAGRGMAFGGARVPIVIGGILFDLMNGGEKFWGVEPPYAQLAMTAADRATVEIPLGNAGAGLGARAGGLKGGIGSASFVFEEAGREVTVGALVAVNAVGSVVMPGQATMWAWALEQDGELGGQPLPTNPLDGGALDFRLPGEPESGTGETPPRLNTSLAVVATDATLTQSQALRLAVMAQDGFARAIRPVHAPVDGDSVFALATGHSGPLDPVGGLTRLGMLGADCVTRATARAVYEAEDLGDLRSYRSLYAGRSRHRM